MVGDPLDGGKVVVVVGVMGDTGEVGKALGQDAREGGNLKRGSKYLLLRFLRSVW